MDFWSFPLSSVLHAASDLRLGIDLTSLQDTAWTVAEKRATKYFLLAKEG